MRIIMFSFFILMLTSCAELSKFKVGEDGYYHFKNYPFAVWAPESCLLDMFVEDADAAVKFTTGRGYWTASGEYTLLLYGVSPDTLGNKSKEQKFIEAAKSVVSEKLSKDGYTLKEFTSKEVNGKPASQGVYIKENHSVWIVTSVLYKSGIAESYLLYPLKEGENYNAIFPWQCYNRFVNSIHET